MTATMTSTISTVEVCETTGATYRQLDYWIHAGVLRSQPRRLGSGNRRTFTSSEVDVVRVLMSINDVIPEGGSSDRMSNRMVILRRIADQVAADPTLADRPILHIATDGTITDHPVTGWRLVRSPADIVGPSPP